MSLTNVVIDSDIHVQVKIKALESGVNLTPLLNEIVKNFLQNPQKKDIINKAKTGGKDANK